MTADRHAEANPWDAGNLPTDDEIAASIPSTHKVIAHALNISPRTIEVHRARIMQKLEARNLAHLVEMMLTSGAKAPGPR